MKIVPALVVGWSMHSPERLGEVALLAYSKAGWLLGRGPAQPNDPFERLHFGRQRPGEWIPMGPLQEKSISRHQLHLTLSGGGIKVRQLGRCPLAINGHAAPEGGTVLPGDTILLQNQLLLVCALRPINMPVGEHFPPTRHGDFGEADGCGQVGESWPMWQLRERLAFLSALDEHTLILGPSGSGKELAARTLQLLSNRRSWVSRNASTLPASLAVAELFGNARNYPNPGTPEREGLFGRAHGGCLFLDEIGELPHEAQAHFLRVLDAEGEYQRLGESRTRRADVRVLAATNRAPEVLKTDFLSRFALTPSTVPLDQRREDIPLLIQHLLKSSLAQSPILRRFVDPHRAACFRLAPELVDWLVRQPYKTHVRELKARLWEALSHSEGRYIELPPDFEPVGAGKPEGLGDVRAPNDLTEDEIAGALAEAQGNVTHAAEALQLSSRHVLNRLIKKHGLTLDAFRPPSEPKAP